MSATTQAAATVVAGATGAIAGAGDGPLLQLVSFAVGAEEYAIPILAVQEINRMMAITRVPQSPPFVEGVINLRGRIIPVMNLRQRFGLECGDRSKDSRIIVVEIKDGGDSTVSGAHPRIIGFTVDRVNEVLRIDSSIVEPPPAMTRGADSGFVDGVGKLKDRLLILLNLHKLFTAAEISACGGAAAAQSDRHAA